jgi:PAS domain S-box-containing protein
MIKAADIMLSNPSFVYADDTICQARVVAGHDKISGILVVDRSEAYVGILNKTLINQEHLPVNAPVSNYVDSSVTPLFASDPVSVIAKVTLEYPSAVLPVLSGEGKPVGVIPDPQFLKDILNDAIKSLSAVVVNVDLTDYGMIVINDEGKIVYFNVSAESILGMKGKNLYGIHVNKVIHDSRLCEVVRKGQPQLMKKLQADGVTLCSNRFPLYKGNEIIGAVGIFKDISENELLLQNMRDLRGLNLDMVGVLESMNDGIVVMDDRGKVIRINSAYESITGLTANQILGENIDFLIGRGCMPALVFPTALEKTKTFNVIKTIGGRDFLIVASPAFGSEGKLIRIVVILKDIDYLNELILNLRATKGLALRCCTQSVAPKNRISQEDMVANSLAMRRVVSLAHKIADVDSNVLITGETGVGKEIVARAMHKCSNRTEGPFIKLNCGAIPEALLESELFGYESGAFTGAKKDGKVGLVELADCGTLFLDEVGDLPMNLQIKLLRVLQEREVMRVGGTKYKKVDFRLITATNRDLEELVKGNLFREDLFYRLNVIPVFIPPLKDRKEDIVPLIMFFLNKFNKKHGLNKKLSSEVIQSLLKYDWPGNIRELENTVERLMVTSDGSIISINDLTNRGLREKGPVVREDRSSPKVLVNVMEETEKKLVYEAVQLCKTTREMSKILGISQSAVVKKMKRYGITKPLEVNLSEKS